MNLQVDPSQVQPPGENSALANTWIATLQKTKGKLCLDSWLTETDNTNVYVLRPKICAELLCNNR